MRLWISSRRALSVVLNGVVLGELLFKTGPWAQKITHERGGHFDNSSFKAVLDCNNETKQDQKSTNTL